MADEQTSEPEPGQPIREIAREMHDAAMKPLRDAAPAVPRLRVEMSDAAREQLRASLHTVSVLGNAPRISDQFEGLNTAATAGIGKQIADMHSSIIGDTTKISQQLASIAGV